MDTEQARRMEAQMIRIESMLGFMLGSEQAEQVTAPTQIEAKQLDALGLPPWPRIRRQTTRLEVWREGFLKQMAAHQAQPIGDDNGEE